MITTMLYDSTEGLCWVESSKINVFPCSGRGNTLSDTVNIPLDLEARLATERNYTNMTANNGYKKSFMQLKDGKLKELVLNGYRFTFTELMEGEVTEGYSEAAFDQLNANNIYAVIKTKTTTLFTHNRKSTTTPALRHLTESESDAALDTLTGDKPYFYGLAFTTESGMDKLMEGLGAGQEAYFLQIIKGGVFNQEALLPSIDHGNTENSVKMGSVQVNSLSLGANNLQVPALHVQQTGDTYQLQFSYSAANPN